MFTVVARKISRHLPRLQAVSPDRIVIGKELLSIAFLPTCGFFLGKILSVTSPRFLTSFFLPFSVFGAF